MADRLRRYLAVTGLLCLATGQVGQLFQPTPLSIRSINFACRSQGECRTARIPSPIDACHYALTQAYPCTHVDALVYMWEVWFVAAGMHRYMRMHHTYGRPWAQHDCRCIGVGSLIRRSGYACMRMHHTYGRPWAHMRDCCPSLCMQNAATLES